MNDTAFDCDVAIVGFGPSGVAAANLLGHYGISTIAFERDPTIYTRARAVTVNDWTMRCFQSVGLDRVLAEDMDETRALRWVTYDGTELFRMNVPPSTLGHATSYAIYQPLMEKTLRLGVERFRDHVDVRYGSEVIAIDQDAAGASLTSTDLATGRPTVTRTRYVLACDGGSSAVRRAVGATMQGDTLEVRWIIIDTKVKRWWPNRDVLTFWSDSIRPVVDIALARGNHRWEIPLNPGEQDEDFASEEQVWALLKTLGVTRDDVDYHQHAFYNHHVRMADRWRTGRVFLVGDAAHLMPPWAGSGMQSGIRDAFNLSWKLREVLTGRLSADVLDSYQVERELNVRFFTEASVMYGKIIKQELKPEEMAALSPPPGTDPAPSPVMMPPTYAAGWFTGPTSPDSAVGKMIPQPRVATPQGVIGPLDDVLGDGFVLVGDGCDPASALSTEQRAAWDQIEARYVALRSADESTEGPDEIVDVEGVLRAWLRGYGARIVALRPDRFVAAADVTGLDRP